MTKRAYRLVVGAYLLLALGAIVTLTLIANQASQIDNENKRLAAAAAVYCEVGRLPDPQETVALDRLAALIDTFGGHPSPERAARAVKTPACRTIADWLRDGDE
jgi:hypothetical protein